MKEMLEQALLPQVVYEQVDFELNGQEQSGKWKEYAEYNYSGIEWLTKIPVHWHCTVIKRCLSSLKDGTHGTFQRVAEGIPLLSAKNVDNGTLRVTDAESLISEADYNSIHQNGYLKTGDLLLTIVGTIGRTAIFNYPEPVAFQRSVAVLRVCKEYLTEYFHYLIQSGLVQTFLKSRAKQSAQSGIYLTDVSLIPVIIPPFLEQQTIVTFLDHEITRINTLIAKKEQHIALLQERRTAIINQAVTKGLNADVAIKDSRVEWLGEIPEHWEVRRLKFIADTLSGATKGKDFIGRKTVDLPYLRVANVQDGYLDLSDIATITVAIEEVKRYSLKPGDVLMNEGGDFDKLGRGFIWDGSIDPCLHQNHVFAVRPFTRQDSSWINMITQTSYAKHYFILKSKQSTNLASISKTNIQNLPVILPPTKERLSILTYIEQETTTIDKLITGIQESIKKLKEYSTALISAAVTGQIDVRREVVAESAENVTI